LNALQMPRSFFGSDLTARDYEALAARWISREDGQAAGLRRVDRFEGCEMFGRKSGDLAGIIIPNILPGTVLPREYRIRLDHPEYEFKKDGNWHETRKYLQPPGRPNLLYFPPTLPASLLQDINIPLVIVEGEFKTIALWRLARHLSESPRFLPVGVAGVWNFRNVREKVLLPDGHRAGAKGLLLDFDRINLSARKVIIGYDADIASNGKVLAARTQLSRLLIDLGATIGHLEWNIEEGKGIDDRLANIGPDRVLADISAVEFGDWRTKLIRTEKGNLIACYENAALFLENHPDWLGVLGYNEFTGGYEVRNHPPEPISALPGAEIEDHFETELIRWYERQGLMAKPELISRTVDAVARKNAFHPVREYLESLPAWDGVSRIGTWLTDYCGVESSDKDPNIYAGAIGEKYLISAVARVYVPGCKCDHTLVLEGSQGAKKSTAVKILAGDDWFTDQIADFGNKDASMQLRGVWMVELAELDAVIRADPARTKSFLTQQHERFRLPYGRRVVKIPRQCVFVGTTNQDTWLKDETGGRRFWPVRCGDIDEDGLRRDRDQLWAEALYKYRAGTTIWLDEQSLIRAAEEEQRGRVVEDPWLRLIEAFVENQQDFTSVAAVLTALGIDLQKWDQAAANRVARCLKLLRWRRVKRRLKTAEQPPEADDLTPRGKKYEWSYVPPLEAK
jgi:predicted P-loop ATPase